MSIKNILFAKCDNCATARLFTDDVERKEAGWVMYWTTVGKLNIKFLVVCEKCEKIVQQCTHKQEAKQ